MIAGVAKALDSPHGLIGRQPVAQLVAERRADADDVLRVGVVDVVLIQRGQVDGGVLSGAAPAIAGVPHSSAGRAATEATAMRRIIGMKPRFAYGKDFLFEMTTISSGKCRRIIRFAQPQHRPGKHPALPGFETKPLGNEHLSAARRPAVRP
nr:hypothetical protein [Mycobacterium shigaense]